MPSPGSTVAVAVTSRVRVDTRVRAPVLWSSTAAPSGSCAVVNGAPGSATGTRHTASLVLPLIMVSSPALVLASQMAPLERSVTADR
ncbi:MAG: hypothetical protein AB7O92_11355 [Acidimicrobiia bacterium]